MLRIPLAALSACLLVASAPALGQAPPPVAQTLRELREIESAALQGDGDRLRQAYQDALKAKPNDVMARLYAAWCIVPSEASWNEIKAVAAMYPDVPWGHYGLGRIYLRWKVPDQAERAFKTALTSRKEFFPAIVGLGDTARAQGKLLEAEARYREALALADDAEAHVGLGLALLALGRKPEGVQHLSKGLEQWPDQPEALLTRAQLAREAKDERAASQYAGQLAQLTLREKGARRALADLLFELGDKAPAAKQYEALLKQGEKDGEILKRLMGLYTELRDPEGLQRVLGQLASRDPSDPQVPLQLAEIAEAQGRTDEAFEYINDAVRRAPNRGDLRLKLARMLVARQELKGALEAYRTAEQLGERSPERQREQLELTQTLRLPNPPVSGKVDQIYARVSASLMALYKERLRDHDDFGGALKLRVQVDGQGKATEVEVSEDTVQDPVIAGHVYFALKDAVFPKQKREPVFEFELKAPSGR